MFDSINGIRFYLLIFIIMTTHVVADGRGGVGNYRSQHVRNIPKGGCVQAGCHEQPEKDIKTGVIRTESHNQVADASLESMPSEEAKVIKKVKSIPPSGPYHPARKNAMASALRTNPPPKSSEQASYYYEAYDEDYYEPYSDYR